MKIKRKLLSVLLSLLIFIQIFVNTKFITNATSLQNTFSVGNITIGNNTYSCFEYSDPTLLPDTFQCYWVQNGKVQHAIWSEVMLVVLNKKLGLALSNNWFTSFYSYVNSQITAASQLAGSFFTGQITRVSNGSAVIGVAFNDLSGYSLTDDNTGDCTVPSTVTNNIYNFTELYLENNPVDLDYIIVETVKVNDVLNDLNSTYINRFNDIKSNLTSYFWNYSFSQHNFRNTSVRNFTYGDSLFVYKTESATTWNNLISSYNLSDQNNTISTIASMTSAFAFDVKIVDKSTMQVINSSTEIGTRYYLNSTTESSLTGNSIPVFVASDNYILCGTENMTVYKNLNIPLNIQNNTYQKSVYFSTNYKNYNTSSDNSTNMTRNEINNSTTNNTNIYNESKTTTNNNTENNNYNIDNSVNDNSVTTIINNYYGDSSGGDDDGDDDDDDDDSIWKALLKAIGDFFKKIGELLATILTGIITLFTDILSAITQITTGFTAITDFLGSIFSWLPTEIVAILTLGLSLGVFICLIKLFK